MWSAATLLLVLTAPVQAQDAVDDEAALEEEEPEPESITLPVSKGLKGETAKGDAVPAGQRRGSKVVTEEGHEIAFIELDPKEESSLPPAWMVAAAVGFGMFVLGALASLFLFRATPDEQLRE